MRVLACVLIIAQVAWSQSEPYQLPFASSGNMLELTVANTSSIVTSNVTVTAKNFPSWLNISPSSVSFALMKPEDEFLASFSFSIDKTAPVKTEHSLSFVITNSNNEQWTKEIRITVNPPEFFELFQNYPNPFNPATTISYQMLEGGHVSLRIHDVLGREVAVLVDEPRPSGFHEERWDASRFASGMYVFQLVLTDRQNNRKVFRKTMLLVK